MTELEKAAVKEFIEKEIPMIVAAEAAKIPAPYGVLVASVLSVVEPALIAALEAKVLA